MSNQEKPKVEELAKELKGRKQIVNFFAVFALVIGIPILVIGMAVMLSDFLRWFLSWNDTLKFITLSIGGLFGWVSAFFLYMNWNQHRIEELEKQVGHKDKSDD